jgi:hypothetical protein
LSASLQLQELAETADTHRRASSEHLDALTRLKYECQETERQLHEAQAVAAEKGAELRVIQQERDALVARLHDKLTSAATSAAAVGDAAEAREGRAAEQVREAVLLVFPLEVPAGRKTRTRGLELPCEAVLSMGLQPWTFRADNEVWPSLTFSIIRLDYFDTISRVGA